MSPHHTDQMSQWSQVSRIALCMAKVKVSDSVSDWVSEWQGHLLSCSGQLKICGAHWNASLHPLISIMMIIITTLMAISTIIMITTLMRSSLEWARASVEFERFLSLCWSQDNWVLRIICFTFINYHHNCHKLSSIINIFVINYQHNCHQLSS